MNDTTIDFILYVLALICFVVAAFVVGRAHPVADPAGRPTVFVRINFVALGLMFWVLVPLIHAFPSH